MTEAVVQAASGPGTYRMVDYAQPQDLQQTYPALPDSVRAARQALTRFAVQAGASTEQVEAVRLAASEALTNAVKHAYPDSEGSVQLTAAIACGELCVLIADDGCGIRPHLSHGGLGVGLTLIASLCDELQIVKRSSGGTGVWLWFKLRTEAPLACRSSARIGGIRDRSRDVALFDHDPAGSGVHQRVLPWDVVALDEDEPSRVRADLFVLPDG